MNINKKHIYPGLPDKFSVETKVDKETYNKIMEFGKANNLKFSDSVKKIIENYFELEKSKNAID